MPKFDADEKYEPIEIKIGGKNYVINDITQGMLDKISELSAEAEKDKKAIEDARANNQEIPARTGPTGLHKQLAVITGESAETFLGVDIRKVIGAIKFFTDQITAETKSGKDSAEYSATQ